MPRGARSSFPGRRHPRGLGAPPLRLWAFAATPSGNDGRQGAWSPMTDSLREYHRKRDFKKTPEPDGDDAPRTGAGGKLSDVIQKHAARQLHYDFRLEQDGVLRSCAVPKGPSCDPGASRLAVRPE